MKIQRLITALFPLLCSTSALAQATEAWVCAANCGQPVQGYVVNDAPYVACPGRTIDFWTGTYKCGGPSTVWQVDANHIQNSKPVISAVKPSVQQAIDDLKAQCPEEQQMILFKTKNSDGTFDVYDNPLDMCRRQ